MPRAYYVNNIGSDKNTGTRKNPFKTISRINKVILRPGDSILLRAGQVFKGSLVISKFESGLSTLPVSVFSYGHGKAIIDAGNKIGFVADGAKFIKIGNLQIKGSGRKEGSTTNGLLVSNCSHVSLENITVSGFQKAGLLVYSSSDVVLSRIHANENGFAGILVEGQNGKKNSRNIFIKDCLAENNPGDPTVLNNHSGNGILVGNSTSVKIEYCVATNNGWDMPRVGNGPVGIWCYESDSITIQYCISYRNKTSRGGDDGGGFDFDGGVTNSVMRYCLSYENEGSAFGIFQYAGASPWNNNVISHSISENDGKVSAAHASAYIWNSSDDEEQFKNLSFHSNILYNAEGAAIHYAHQSKRKLFEFRNNIFIAKGHIVAGDILADSYNDNSAWNLAGKFKVDSSESLKTSFTKEGKKQYDSIAKWMNGNPVYTPIGSRVKDPRKLKSVIDNQLGKYSRE